MVFQQFQGGVIIAKNDEPGTPAYITWGKIREAWNVQRDPDGIPEVGGKNGSPGPLGAPTSDENPVGDLLVTTFEHGKIDVQPEDWPGRGDGQRQGRTIPACIVKLFENACGAVDVNRMARRRCWLTASFRSLRR